MTTNYRSAHLGGVADAFSATDHADFKPTGAFTVGAWFKTTVAAAQNFSQSSAYTSSKLSGWWLVITAAGLVEFGSAKNTGQSYPTDYGQSSSGVTAYKDGLWHWAVGVYDGAHLNLYVDAVLCSDIQAWTSAPVYQATNYVRVGNGSDTGDSYNFFNGNLDEVFVINGTAWNQATVTSYYKHYITGATNLKAYYQFEDVLTDSSGFGHTLTAIGSPTFQNNVPFTQATTNYLNEVRRGSSTI